MSLRDRLGDPRLWQRCNTGVAAVVLILFVVRMVLSHSGGRGWWGYSATEWLINYGGGFIRRGLAGEIIMAIPAPSDLVAVELWTTAIMSAIVVLFAMLVHRVLARTATPWALFLWALPTWFLTGPLQSLWQPNLWITGTQFATRKEQWYLATVLVAALWWRARRPDSARGWAVSVGAISALLTLGALFHEGLWLPAAAAVVLLWWQVTPDWRWARRGLGVAALTVPGMAGVIAAVTHLGTTADRDPVWLAVDAPTRDWYFASSEPAFRPQFEGVPAAIGYLGSAPGDGAMVVRAAFLDTGVWLWWLGIVVAISVAAATLLLLCDSSRSGVRSLVVTAAVMAAIFLPLALIAYDWGRWLAFATNLVVVITLARVGWAPDVRSAPVTARAAALAVGAVLMANAVGIQEVGNAKELYLGLFVR